MIINALKRAEAMYLLLRRKDQAGKKGKTRYVDFQKILSRLESRQVEVSEALVWIYRFCDQHGDLSRLVYCILSELSLVLKIPLVAKDVLQQEIQRFAAETDVILVENETIATLNIIYEQKAKLESITHENKEKLAEMIFQDLMSVKVKTLH